MLLSCSNDQTIRLWNLLKRNLVRTFADHSEAITSLACSPDGRFIASGCVDSSVKLWDLQDAYNSAELQGHSDEVLCVSFSPDGNLLASGSEDNTI
jgi:WD40 repeat protein